ncbi:MAG TPA: D-TA family PLP-dependent enzyme [Cyclobacteriaceae bacterium]|jgi:D-serine deaminase-like pyridoxal phosphate-dependent protein|nr:D-TA family PLP-dependent enzyme [Cyclobacteriaceae bacterium]
MNNFWYTIENIEEIDSPALAVYFENVMENISILKSFVKDVNSVRPHVKTHKSAEITKLLLDEGITKFKCATIAEAEMLAVAGAQDILLAYQPVGPKVKRLATLVEQYPTVLFSCLIDSISSAKFIASVFERRNIHIDVFIDLNVGMNRTGITPSNAFALFEECTTLKGITVKGLHAYDGHLRDPDMAVRTQQCNDAFAQVETLRTTLGDAFNENLVVVAGGTPTFPIHAKRNDVECSPGTFIYWDKGYQSILHEQPFLFGALVITRVVSKPTEDTICVDLGHKSIASESPLDKRVYFLNAPNLVPTGHSEEHLVLKITDNTTYEIGDVLYGVPHHICPTVALHDQVQVVKENKVTGQWKTLARNRVLTV